VIKQNIRPLGESRQQAGRHSWKFGWDYSGQTSMGRGEQSLQPVVRQISDLGLRTYYSGVYFLNAQGGLAANDNVTLAQHTRSVRSRYWKDSRTVTLTWGCAGTTIIVPEQDEFFSAPRVCVGLITPKSSARYWGLFYDTSDWAWRETFQVGGANLVSRRFSFRGFSSGNPSTITPLFALLTSKVPCASSDMNGRPIAASGPHANSPNRLATPLFGLDTETA